MSMEGMRKSIDDGVRIGFQAEFQWLSGLISAHLRPMKSTPGLRSLEVSQTRCSSAIFPIRIADGESLHFDVGNFAAIWLACTVGHPRSERVRSEATCRALKFPTASWRSSTKGNQTMAVHAARN